MKLIEQARAKILAAEQEMSLAIKKELPVGTIIDFKHRGNYIRARVTDHIMWSSSPSVLRVQNLKSLKFHKLDVAHPINEVTPHT